MSPPSCRLERRVKEPALLGVEESQEGARRGARAAVRGVSVCISSRGVALSGGSGAALKALEEERCSVFLEVEEVRWSPMEEARRKERAVGEESVGLKAADGEEGVMEGAEEGREAGAEETGQKGAEEEEDRVREKGAEEGAEEAGFKSAEGGEGEMEETRATAVSLVGGAGFSGDVRGEEAGMSMSSRGEALSAVRGAESGAALGTLGGVRGERLEEEGG